MGRIFLILKSSPGCQTLSNAWLTSKNAAVENWWFSRALLMVSATRWHCCIVEWACLKLNWWFGIQLKELLQEGLLNLMYILNAIIRLEYWPKSLKQAQFIMLPKPGKNPIDITSYRPISLLPTISKVLEKLILKRINKESNPQY
jgi:hypothetical protein